MHDAVMKEVAGTDIFIGTAAVADYRPAAPADCKIKKVSDTLDLCMERTVDILATVAQRADRPVRRGLRRRNQQRRGARAVPSCVRKNLDLIAANEVGDAKVFEADDNALMLLWPNGGRLSLGAGAKTELAATADGFHRDALQRRAARRDPVRRSRVDPLTSRRMQQLKVRVLDARLGSDLAAARLCHRRFCRPRPARRASMRPRCWRRAGATLIPTGMAIHIDDPG